jgi:hypothetical protein
MTELKNKRLRASAAQMKNVFASVSEDDLADAMRCLRRSIRPGLPRAACAAAAYYCISLDLWPLEAAFERGSNAMSSSTGWGYELSLGSEALCP